MLEAVDGSFLGLFSVLTVRGLTATFVFWINPAVEISKLNFCYTKRMKGSNPSSSGVELEMHEAISSSMPGVPAQKPKYVRRCFDRAG